MKKTLRYVVLSAFFVLAAGAGVAHASALDPRVSRDAWRIITKVEFREGIPRGLLHSMSLVETGMAQEGKVLPWPFTANINTTEVFSTSSRAEALAHVDALRRLGFESFSIGADQLERRQVTHTAAERFLNGIDADVYTVTGLSFSRRFANKDEAVRFVTVIMDAGHNNVDVGLMQVNMKYHGQNFDSLDDAFDPYKNVVYAVSYLRKHRQTRDWWDSVGRYHSGTRMHSDRYVKTVYAMYQKVSKLNLRT